MQRVVRSTLAALTLAGLAACGDKVTVPPAVTTPAVTPVVRGVTVTPPTASMNVGDKLTFSASVNADAGITDRTVTWSSGNTAIATVDANGLVTAVATGTTTIKATSKADASQSASAVVTVGSTGTPGGSGQATIVLSNINQTRCDINGGCTSVPANLGAVTGQLDVTVNVDPGTAKLQEVDLIMNCGGADTVVAKQVLATASIAAASEAAAPVTLSFNTASFNTTTGASAFRNGACTLKAKAVTSGGSVTSTAQAVTLANVDAIVGTVTATKTATDATGLAWNGGAVTITAIPVFYTTGRSAAASGGTITYEGKTASNLTATNGAFSATFTDSNMGGTAASGDPLDIDQITDRASQATIVVNVVDNNGQNVTQVAACGTSVCSSQSVLAGAAAPVIPAGTPFRLDTQKPLPGFFAIKNNPTQLTSPGGYVNGSFKFSADSASGYCGPNSTGYTSAAAAAAANAAGTPVCTGKYTANIDSATTQGGVDKVTVTFITKVTGASNSTYTARTSTAGLGETSATSGNSNSYTLRMITADALGNADSTTVGTFGIDLTPPTVTLTGGPVNQATFNAIGGSGTYTLTVGDSGSIAASGGSLDAANGNAPRALVAQTRLYTGLTASTSNFSASSIEGNSYTNATANMSQATSPILNTAAAAANVSTTLSPCQIGRFNASASNAGPNALTAYSASGAIVGYCTPVFYDIGGGIPAAVNSASTAGGSSTGGYFNTVVIAVDQAGNQNLSTFATGNVDQNIVLEDATVPAVTGVDMPGSISGNSTVSFPASSTDNIDLVSGYAVVNMNAVGMNLRYAPTAGPGTAFDNVLTTSGSISPTVPNFMRSLQASAAAGSIQGSTVGAANNAGSVTVTAVDGANNQASRTGALTAVALGTQSSTSFNGTFNQGFFLTDNAGGIVWNCAKTGCGPAGTSTPTNTSITFTAVAGGTTSTFNNPFAAVQFWYQVASGQWLLAGTATASSVTDDGSIRRWSYQLSWDPPATAYDATSLTPAPGGTIVVPVRAIGINSSGDAVYTSNAYNLTIQN